MHLVTHINIILWNWTFCTIVFLLLSVISKVICSSLLKFSCSNFGSVTTNKDYFLVLIYMFSLNKEVLNYLHTSLNKTELAIDIYANFWQLLQKQTRARHVLVSWPLFLYKFRRNGNILFSTLNSFQCRRGRMQGLCNAHPIDSAWAHVWELGEGNTNIRVDGRDLHRKQSWLCWMSALLSWGMFRYPSAPTQILFPFRGLKHPWAGLASEPLS